MNSVTDLAAILVALAVLVGLLVVWFTWTAGRLDRMHLRLEAARAGLDAQLARRAGLAAELGASGGLDPASALLLLEAADQTRDTGGADRWQAESELTAVLREVGVPAPDAEPLVSELVHDLDEATRRAGMARRIHNDLATATRGLHDRRRVRWFRLAGHAEPPELLEFDDRPRS